MHTTTPIILFICSHIDTHHILYYNTIYTIYNAIHTYTPSTIPYTLYGIHYTLSATLTYTPCIYILKHILTHTHHTVHTLYTHVYREEVGGVRQARDPIEYIKKLLLDNSLASADELKSVEKDIRASVQVRVFISM